MRNEKIISVVYAISAIILLVLSSYVMGMNGANGAYDGASAMLLMSITFAWVSGFQLGVIANEKEK